MRDVVMHVRARLLNQQPSKIEDQVLSEALQCFRSHEGGIQTALQLSTVVLDAGDSDTMRLQELVRAISIRAARRAKGRLSADGFRVAGCPASRWGQVRAVTQSN